MLNLTLLFLEPHNRKPFAVAGHIFVWLLLLLFPFLLASEQADFHRVIRLNWVPMFFYAGIFYFNHLYFIDRFLFNKKIVTFILVNVAIMTISTWLIFEIKEYLFVFTPPAAGAAPGTLPAPRPFPKYFIYKDALSLIIPIIFSIALKSTENWTRIANEKKEIERENLSTELLHLKYQLQPHFFFNSLNTIYSLVEQSPEKAQETIHTLSKLMRYMLYESDTETSNLSMEIEFMKQYIALMKLRLSDKTSVQANFPALAENYRITPLLFISIIENAFKHGVSATQPSDIFFSLTADNHTIRFFAENTNFPKNGSDKSGSGIGLVNLQKRLELSYPGKHNFQTKVEGPLFNALLEIQLN